MLRNTSNPDDAIEVTLMDAIDTDYSRFVQKTSPPVRSRPEVHPGGSRSGLVEPWPLACAGGGRSGTGAGYTSTRCRGWSPIPPPDMILVARAKSDARPVMQPQPPAVWLFRRHLQPFTTPPPHHPPMADLPTLRLQQCVDAPVSVTAILPR